MDKISVTLEMCTFYNGLPHGIALISHTNPYLRSDSFRGVGVFLNGELHNLPFCCLQGNGYPLSVSKMKNGRPADGSYVTYFYENGCKVHVDSLDKETNVSGW